MDKEHLNIHDPHNQHTWADDQLPWWVAPLKAVGVIAIVLGVITVIYLLGGV